MIVLPPNVPSPSLERAVGQIEGVMKAHHDATTSMLADIKSDVTNKLADHERRIGRTEAVIDKLSGGIVVLGGLGVVLGAAWAVLGDALKVALGLG